VTTLALPDVRERAAQALAPMEAGDPPVVSAYVDAIEPPLLVLEWQDPWLVPQTMGMSGGWWDAQLAVVCFAGRLEPGAGIDVLEQLVAHVVQRLDADPYGWPAATSQAPRALVVGGVPYLAARVVYHVPVSLEV
jgi:hypothetical protein